MFTSGEVEASKSRRGFGRRSHFRRARRHARQARAQGAQVPPVLPHVSWFSRPLQGTPRDAQPLNRRAQPAFANLERRAAAVSLERVLRRAPRHARARFLPAEAGSPAQASDARSVARHARSRDVRSVTHDTRPTTPADARRASFRSFTKTECSFTKKTKRRCCATATSFTRCRR